MQPLPQSDGDGEGQLKPIAVSDCAAEPKEAYQASGPGAAPQPTPQPATQAPTAQAAAPPAARQGARRPSVSLSIKGARKSASPEPAAQPQASAPQPRKSPYTDDQLLKAWIEYAEQHPTERILVNTMLAARPVRIDGDRYLVPVDDNIQVETINESRAQILGHLRTALDNDGIDIDVRVTAAESSPVTWTQREVLQHMVEARPALRDMIQTLGLTLM